MKKRFTLMMMVLCILMSIPLKMMAYDEVTAVSHYLTGEWGPNSNFIFTTNDGIIYTCTLDNVPSGTQAIWFRIVKGDKEYGPGNGSSSDLVLTGTYQQIFEGTSNALKIVPTSGKTSYTITYNYETNQIKYDAPESGGTEGGGGTTTEKWNTVTTNRLTGKKYSQGFYLAGNFFTFDEKDKINYDDAVFKFQQQKDQSINAIVETAETAYDVYMVEIPASLTAHAQVMYVDKTGKAVKVFGPTSACGISETYPTTAGATNWETLNGTVKFSENNNYWDFSTRNKPNIGYSDGLYEVYIAVDKRTHEPAKWMIKHQALKRVAYFISDAPDATAMPIYDAYTSDEQGGRFYNKFFATVDLAANRSYYVISNYVNNNNFVEWASSYGAFKTGIHAISCPTTNKLFMLGNGGVEFTKGRPQNEVLPNEAPVKINKRNFGVQILEYDPSKGDNTRCRNTDHYGFIGEIQLRTDRAVLTSVSLVGDAIPGTTNADGTWNYKSNVADMTYDETEQCYKATVVTTVADNGQSKFRFVGNHDPQITWFENTNTDEKEMAKHPHDSTDPNVHGHTADVNDPNKVDYTENGDPTSKDYDSWNIIWNRPAGRWTVRLYFYTHSDGTDHPVNDYYYTITRNMDMELHDVGDVIYGSEDNKQIITNLDGYKFMRTWSAKKAWKISNKVDIFVVSDIKDEGSVVKMTLTNINDYVSKDERVIPPNTGVILATKSDASEISGAQFKSRQNFTSYNNLVIPMEQYNTDKEYPKENNKLEKILVSDVIPSSDEKHYNYFFGYYNAQIATGGKANEYLLGFWISKGSKPYPSNSCYLPIDKETAAKMKYLGTSYKDYVSGGGSAKKIPALLFDFANVSGTTGINEVVNQSTKLNDGKYYTLSGQQVEKPTAGGIYIHNGRKFVVK
mgnify:CR=1 FL=1